MSRKLSSITRVKAILLLSLLFCAGQAYCAAQGRYNEAEGKYLDPRVKTNVNKVDPLFDDNIHDYRSFERDMLEHKKGIAAGVGRGSGTEDVAGAAEAIKAANDLSGIEANNLESKGRAEGAADGLTDEIFVDWSKPGYMQIKDDMEEIGNASGNMMNVILSMLKDIGVDCKSVKGNTQIEPQYHIDLKNRASRDKGETVYDQHFCEQPRREYNCTDEVAVTCKRKGMKWGEWQNKEITVPGLELVEAGYHVFHIDYGFHYTLILAPHKYKHGEGYIKPEQVHIQSMRKYLATKHPNASEENISEEMTGTYHGEAMHIGGAKYLGRTLGGKDIAFQYYTIKYKYREGSPGCLEWSEDWSEQCQLQ